MSFTKAELKHLKVLVEYDYQNGRRVIYENPKASLLIEEWNKCLKIDMNILEEISKLIEEIK